MDCHDSTLGGRWSLVGNDGVVLVASIILLPIQQVVLNSGFREQGYVGCSFTDLIIDDISFVVVDLVDVEGDDGLLEVPFLELEELVVGSGSCHTFVGLEGLDGCIVLFPLFGFGFIIQPLLEFQLLGVVLLEEALWWTFVLLVLLLVVILYTPERSVLELADLARIRVGGD